MEFDGDLVFELEEVLRAHGIGSCQKAAGLCMRWFITEIISNFGIGAPNYGNEFQSGYKCATREILEHFRGEDFTTP